MQVLRREGCLFSSHQMSDVEQFGARIVILNHGVVCFDRELGRRHEEFSIVTVEREVASDATVLERMPSRLRVRATFDAWHAVFERPPDPYRLPNCQFQIRRVVDGQAMGARQIEDERHP